MQNQAMTCLICCRQRYDSRPQCGSVCSLCHQLLQGWANGAAGSSCLAHLLSACWASSSLAASNEKAAALRVSSPQYFQESSIKSPYRLALQALRKLSRRTDRRARVVTLAGGFFPHPVYSATVILGFHKRHPPWSLSVVISLEAAWGQKWNGPFCFALWRMTRGSLFFFVLFPGSVSLRATRAKPFMTQLCQTAPKGRTELLFFY